MRFRNDELLFKNSVSLKEIADETASENKAMVSMTGQFVVDSRTTKLATLIATVYLPASLLTVSSPPYSGFYMTKLISIVKTTVVL